ncbi:hypothetical protein LCBD_0575 [Lacticaseibacillus paracasei]|nr:hypothetical protein LCBD_0575 [Lacticaseibacillus paracasei]OPH03154.1 hypothetical protein B4585_12175 [Lacticaseibacillus paracasei]OPH03528.1 hypothetical protein B4586_10540 [Lacticaseibacillus paracasei]OSP82814.1 hypothetical protein B9J76_17130 [Lacticaseibacillus paracasei]
MASRARQHPARFFDAFKCTFNMCVCYTVIGGQLLIFDFIYSQSYVWPPARPSSGALFIYIESGLFLLIFKFVWIVNVDWQG